MSTTERPSENGGKGINKPFNRLDPETWDDEYRKRQQELAGIITESEQSNEQSNSNSEQE